MEIGEPGGFLAWLTDALDSVVRLVSAFQQAPGARRGDEDVFESVLPVVSKFMDHEGAAFMTVGSDGVEFDLSYVVRPANRGQMELEIRRQISEGSFAWALYQSGPVIVPSVTEGQWILLHVLATPGRISGMFIAVLTPPSSFVPDVSQKLLSLVLSETAGVLESRSLQRQQGAGALWLQEMLDARTAALKRAEQAARAADRAKSTFLAQISHEVRTPLNGVVGMASLLLDSDLAGDQRVQAETIHESAHCLLEMINGVLEASHAEAGRHTLEAEEFSLYDVVEEVALCHAVPAAERGIDLIVRYGKSVPDGAVGDAVRVSRVLSILVDNAVRCTEAGHVLLEVDFGTDEDFVIAVADTGQGIDARRVDRIFERFADRADASHPHLGARGLGLSTCKELVSSMGGDIRVQTQLGRGSRFVVVLPLPTAVTPGARSHAASLSGERVSLVCNRQLVAGVAAAVISDDGGKPVAFASLAEAQAAHAAASAPESFVFIADTEAEVPSPGGLWAGPRIAFLPATRMQEADSLLDSGYDHVAPLPVTARVLTSLLSGRNGLPGRDSSGANTFSLEMRGRVLVVEDDRVSQRVAEMMLRRLRCEVVLAADGDEAVSLVLDERFDLVMMDCEMPGMDGFQATQAIRAWEHAREQHVPIVALTARALAEDRDRAFRSGMDDFLTKPIQVEDMEAVVARWIPVRGDHGGPVQPASPEAVGSDVVFDEAAAVRLVGGDPHVLDEIMTLFRESWAALKESVPQSLAEGDTDRVAEVAHRIKGSAGNVGAVLARGAAGRLEQSALAGDERAAARAWLSLDEEVERFLDVVNRSPAFGRS